MNQADRISAMVLAGGKSSRMGRDKADLDWTGITLLDLQIAKLQAMGIRDILISGHAAVGEGVRVIPDVYPGCGPLAGLHACLCAAEHPNCLVLTVDTPLLRSETLQALIVCHLAGNHDATVLTSDGVVEPLIGVYQTGIAGHIEKLLEGNGRKSVRALLNQIHTGYFDFSADPRELLNCNTPEEFAAAKEYGGR